MSSRFLLSYGSITSFITFVKCEKIFVSFLEVITSLSHRGNRGSLRFIRSTIVRLSCPTGDMHSSKASRTKYHGLDGLFCKVLKGVSTACSKHPIGSCVQPFWSSVRRTNDVLATISPYSGILRAIISARLRTNFPGLCVFLSEYLHI